MLGNHADAQDAVQEVFVKIWSKRNSLNNIRNMEAFAITITKNHCTDRLRKPGAIPLELVGLDENHQPNPEQLLEINDSAGLIHLLMQRLPPQQRMVIHLHDVEQMDNHEIAICTGLSSEAIRTNLSRARKKIRTLFTEINTYGLEKS